MARKQPIGYEVRRPLTLWGRKREIGDRLAPSEVTSLGRIESLVRAGRLVELHEEDGATAARTQTGTAQAVVDKPVRRTRKAKQAVE